MTLDGSAGRSRAADAALEGIRRWSRFVSVRAWSGWFRWGVVIPAGLLLALMRPVVGEDEGGDSPGVVEENGGVESPIGRPAPEWTVSDWMQWPEEGAGAAAPRLADLKGKVVLVRWFTLTECPYCSATAPALEEFHREFASAGLRVLGFYHHKRESPLRLDEVRAAVREYGFTFPVAIDHDWRTLRRWWLDGRARAWTSVSFLIDRRGIVRHVHPGGQYVKGDEDHARLRSAIVALLNEDVDESAESRDQGSESASETEAAVEAADPAPPTSDP